MALMTWALKPENLQLYLVTDARLCPGASLFETVENAVRGGVTFVQLRDKTASTEAIIENASALMRQLRGTGIPLVINDNLEAAIASKADGLHIGQSDGNVAEARARLGSEKILGLSCGTLQQVKEADPNMLDYLGIGPVFPTPTKTISGPSLGFSGIAEMAAASPLPTVAIGGLKAEHAARVLQAGCDGVAVVSAICGQPDPEHSAKNLRQAMQQKQDDACD